MAREEVPVHRPLAQGSSTSQSLASRIPDLAACDDAGLRLRGLARRHNGAGRFSTLVPYLINTSFVDTSSDPRAALQK
jgi:hypothetical protein